MPVEKHLVVHLQEMYANEQSYRGFLQDWAHRVQDQQLKSCVTQQLDDIDTEMANLRDCLRALGSKPRDHVQSPVVQALWQEDKDTRQLMPEMTPADSDVHLALTDISFSAMEIADYQGMIAMAKVLGNQDVIDCLQQNLDSERRDLHNVQQLLPDLIDRSQQGQRFAA